MQLTLIIFLLTAVAEAAIYLNFLWKLRKTTALLVAVFIAGYGGWQVFHQYSITSMIIAYFCAYRSFNLMRIYTNRLQVDYLYNASQRSSFYLLLMQGSVFAVAAVGRYLGLGLSFIIWVIAVAEFAIPLMLFYVFLRNIRSGSLDDEFISIESKNMPTLTVAIPARNETADLENCLRSLVASNYPKLEIIVLDDCSQNKHTPEIIQSFAQQGVKFIAGEIPPVNWLAKNYAYKQLAEAANGDLIMFCGVDTAFEPDSLMKLVKTMIKRRANMLCVWPANSTSQLNFLSTLLQPMRYAWELALPKFILKRPPVLSTCWIINRQTLITAGGFYAVSRKIIPEAYFAKRVSENRSGYNLVISNNYLSVRSNKTIAAQQETAIRTRYPQLHKRVESIAFLSLSEFAIFVLPWAILIGSVIYKSWALAAISGAGIVTMSYLSVALVSLTYRRHIISSLWSATPTALNDIWLLNYSMFKYEFREVIWKGRNVCIPVMRILP